MINHLILRRNEAECNWEVELMIHAVFCLLVPAFQEIVFGFLVFCFGVMTKDVWYRLSPAKITGNYLLFMNVAEIKSDNFTFMLLHSSLNCSLVCA